MRIVPLGTAVKRPIGLVNVKWLATIRRPPPDPPWLVLQKAKSYESKVNNRFIKTRQNQKRK
jgi:hypothetical protein